MLPKMRTSAREAAGATIRRHRPDYLILLFMALLAFIGLVVLYSVSAPHSQVLNDTSGTTLDSNAFMVKQSLYLLAGLMGFAATALIPLAWWRAHREKLIWVALGACALLALVGLVHSSLAVCPSGACRWYNFGFLTFQPAELLKFALVVFLSGFLTQRMATKRINNVHDTLIPVGILLIVSLIFIVGVQKDMGTGLSLVGIAASILFMANMKLKYFGIGVAAMVAFTALFIVIAPHRLERVSTFFSSSPTTATADSTSYHITQAKIAIGSGGVIGKGLGNSEQVYGYLPEALTDSMFAILGETFGLVGLVSIMAIFLALFIRLLKTIDHLSDPYLKLFVAGVFGWLASQTIVNIGAMLGVFPLTGVTLPFLSFGGTSLLFVMAALGAAFQASRYTTHSVNDEREPDETTGSRRGLGRSRDARTRRYQRA
jgi:cell division protein FtsW